MAKDNTYPFKEYILEDKSRYKTATEAGYYDPHNLFLIGDSGGFLMNIKPGRFVNTNLFTDMADTYKKYDTYTRFSVDSIPHRQLRRREVERRKSGHTAPCWYNEKGEIENVHISGDYYNFLNYTRMEMTDDATIVTGLKATTAEKKYSFPKFIDAQYWTHNCLEFAKNNGFHMIIVKTRRGGFSYMMAARSANAINLRKHKVFINVAADKKYLTKKGGLTDFAIASLKFYEEKTMFKRGIFSPTVDDFRLGFRLANNVEAEDSWQSSLLSVSAKDNPDCAIGKDAVGVNVEELSTMQNFDKFMEVTEPAMTVGDITTGMLTAWGTASATNMQTFETNFYNPLAYHFMPFENVWDKDARHEICGFFKSYAWGIEGIYDGKHGVDKWGNSDLDVGLALTARGRANKKKNAKSFSEYINYLGQRAIFPAESFSSSTENIFAGEALNSYEERLRVDSSYKFYVDGELFNEHGIVSFKSNERIRKEQPQRKTYDWINGVPRKGGEDPHGCCRIWFPPEPVERYVNDSIKREIPVGTYAVTYDPVGIDKDKNEITDRHSHNSIHVWEIPSERNGFKLKMCAAYYGRPEKLAEADRIFFNFCVWYGCIGTGLVEVNRGETVTNAKQWKLTKYLAYEPLFIWDASVKEKVSSTYGYVISEGIKKLNVIRLFKELMWEKVGVDENGDDKYQFEYWYDYQAILEIKKWNTMGNFDRVSEMLLISIYIKSINIVGTKALQSRKKISESESSNDIMSRPWM